MNGQGERRPHEDGELRKEMSNAAGGGTAEELGGGGERLVEEHEDEEMEVVQKLYLL